MVKSSGPNSGQEAGDVAAVVERALTQAKQVRESKRKAVSVPEVDPDAPGLEQLFAWGQAVAEIGGITPERSRELLAALRQAMNDSSGS